MRAALWALCAAMLFCASATAAPGRSVSFQTEDGWTIGGRYLPPRKSRPVVIFVHGAAAGKGEWEAFQDTLSRRGIGSLAIDLRGHGESQFGPKGRTDFSGFDESGEWARSGKDIEAAVAYLSKRGIPARRIGYVGASIGANLMAAAKPAPRWLALLSPGFNYRGVRLPQPPAGVPVLVAASPPDAYAFRTASEYAAARPDITFLRAKQGHGAQMLADPDFLKGFLDWIKHDGRP